MNVGLFLGHPAHFHYLKNAAKHLQNDGHNVFFVIKHKDILETLLDDSGFSYTKIREGRGNSKFALAKSVIEMEINMVKFIKKNHIDILIGSTLTFAAKIVCRIPVIVIGEDDARVVPFYSKLALPFASALITPKTCNNWKWENISYKYHGYMELGYLHPNNFTPDKKVVEKYFSVDNTYFIFRFASLNAHHDKDIKGINTEIAQNLIDILKPYGQIYITSERELEPQFEQYRIKINPLDMHHVMAFASLYIGDSQTMAAEAGVLGVPFVRFNDFVGRIGYLRELEDVYHLGYGIRANAEPFIPEKVNWIDEEPKVQPCGAEAMYKVVKELVAMDADERRKLYQERRQKMLSEKIDYAKFLTWFIENYPESVRIMKENPDYQYNFR